MLPHLRPIASLMFGTALLLLGNGLLGTLIALRGSLEGYSDQLLGLMGSAYFVGFFIGTYAVPKLIRRMGHIRASNFFSAAIAASILAHSVIIDPWVWMGLRVITGIALVGFYTVIESWLNSQTAAERRGQVFAFYMVVNMVAIAGAQQFLHLAPASELMLFSLAAIMVSLSVMPIASTRLPQPPIAKVPRLTLRTIWAAAPAAFIGAIASGLTMGTFWSMGPLYAARLGLSEAGIATLVTTMIVGGAVLQWPLGRLSDRYDRRHALATAAGGAAIAAVAMALLGHHEKPLLVAAFIYGGTAFAIYPIVVAHLIDHLSQENILSGNAGILLLYGIGAVIGPATAGALMNLLGAAAMPLFFAGVMAPLTAFVILMSRRTRDEIVDSPGQFVPMMRTAETGLEMASAVTEQQMHASRPAPRPAPAAEAIPEEARPDVPSAPPSTGSPADTPTDRTGSPELPQPAGLR